MVRLVPTTLLWSFIQKIDPAQEMSLLLIYKLSAIQGTGKRKLLKSFLRKDKAI